MKRFGIAVCALLLGAGAVAPTCADAAMPSSALRSATAETGLVHYVATGARLRPPQDGFMLAQYGGGRDADDDPPQRNNNNNGGYQQPYQQPQQHRNNNNNNFNNGAAAAGAIINLLGNIAQQKERERQQQQYNDNLRRQKKHQQDIAKERRQQDIIRKRKADAERIERIKREEKIKQIEDAKRDAAKKTPVYPSQNQNQPEEYRPATNQNQPQPDYQPAVTERDPNPYVDVDDNKNPINVITAPYNCPDNFAQLKIGPTVLYPRRTDYPADTSLCAGRTGKGCYLRVVNGPATCGGGRPVCVAYCGTPAPTPAIKRVDPTPTPIVTPPTKYVDDPKPVIVVPPPVVKVTEEAKKTVKATEYTEPKPAPVAAKKTVIASEYVEPKPAPVAAKKTVIASEYVEPKPAPVAAKKTAAAEPYVEPAHKDRPVTQAKQTVVANDVDADSKDSKTEPTAGLDEAEYKPVTPAKKTDVAKNDDPVSKDPGTDPVAQFDDAQALLLDPIQCPTMNLGACGQKFEKIRLADQKLRDDKKKADDASKKKEEERRRADDERKKKQRDALLNPVMDGKCTTEGGKPAAKLVRELPLRETIIGGVSAIPAATTEGIPVGAIVGGIMKLFWKDDGPDSMFKQMKDYVDQMVDGAISNYDTKKLDHEVKGMKNVYQDYEELKTPTTKGRWLEGLIRTLSDQEPNFLDPQSPEKTLADFVAYGSLKVAALQELIANYDKYVPFDPTNKDAKMQHEEDRNHFIRRMNETIKAYTDHAAEVRKKIIEDRVGKVRVEKDGRAYREAVFICAECDMYQQYHDWFTAKDDFCDWRGPGREENAAAANADTERRKEAVRQTYNAILDTLLAPVSNWPSATPMAAPVRTADATPKR